MTPWVECKAEAEQGGGTLAHVVAEHLVVLDGGERIAGRARTSELRKQYAELLLRERRNPHQT